MLANAAGMALMCVRPRPDAILLKSLLDVYEPHETIGYLARSTVCHCAAVLTWRDRR